MSSPHRKQEMRRFGDKMRVLRSRHGMTLQALAQALGYAAHGHFSELESGKKTPTAEFVLRLARFFQVTTDQLLKDELEISHESEKVSSSCP